MNQYFTGYQTAIPVWIFIILFILTVILAWWSYKGLKSRYRYLKYVLISLRSIVYLLILLVLINPVFERTTEKKVKPDVAVLLDNSRSMSVDKGDYHGSSSYHDVLKTLDLKDTSDVRYDIFSFDNKIHQISVPDSLTLNGNESDLSQAVQYLSKSGDNFKALLLVTDGIYTIGRDPSFTAANLGYPVYTVAMGDTVHRNDIIVQNISANREGYRNTIIPVEATIVNDGFPNQKIEVQLWHNRKLIQTKEIQTKDSKSVHSVSFQFKPKDTGLQQYRVVVPEIKGEWTNANNHKVFDIDIRNDKIKILDIAFTIHPDVKTVRSILESDKSIEVKELTWIGRRKFLGGSLPSRIDTMNMVILHGFPNDKLSDSEAATIYDLIKDKPVLLFTTPKTNYTTLNRLFSGQLPIIGQNVNTLSEIEIHERSENSANPILDLPSFDIAHLPVVFAPLQNIKKTPGSTILFEANYHGTNTQIPVIAIRKIGNNRIAQVNFSGFYKWYQNEVPGSRKYITALVNNIVKWTSAKPDNRLLKINPASKIFNGSEKALLNASLTNESGLPESQGRIDVEVEGTNYPQKSFAMINQRLGQYSLDLGVLPAGLYNYTATAMVNSHTLDKEKGQFSVGSTNAEFINTTRNDALLHFISKSSGGVYFTFKTANQIIPALQSNGLLKPIIHTERSRFYIYRSAWWFLILLLLLSSEWFIRKYLALP